MRVAIVVTTWVAIVILVGTIAASASARPMPGPKTYSAKTSYLAAHKN